jgi:RluA family pseudouridine synthase
MALRDPRKAIFTALPEDAGVELGVYVAQRSGLGRAAAEQRVRSGAVYVDDRRELRANRRLAPGQRITVRTPAASAPAPLRVVYADDALIVVDKPAGLPSTLPRVGAGATVETALHELVGAAARLLHRLDQPASGLLLASLDPASRKLLAAQVREHALLRCYAALTAGAPPAERWVMRAPLRFDRRSQRAIGDPSAPPAETHARVLRRLGGLTLLAVELRTGRTHQIRAHLADAGLPLVGDTRYGGPAAARLALHAHRLTLRHPRGALLDLHSPIPADFRALLDGGP